jgi:hypothetical protein
MDLNRAQLCLLRSLLRTGWPGTMTDILLGRCGATAEDWQALIDNRLVTTELELAERHLLTAEGLREYRRQSKGRYF